MLMVLTGWETHTQKKEEEQSFIFKGINLLSRSICIEIQIKLTLFYSRLDISKCIREANDKKYKENSISNNCQGSLGSDKDMENFIHILVHKYLCIIF